MRLVSLISGGKDSCYNMMQCVAAGHEIVALAHMKPKEKDELDSFMYQCVGHNAIKLYSEAMGLPLYQGFIDGGNVFQGIDYIPTAGDEVEDLFDLLKRVKDCENVEGVAVGAILSNYQRVRVENVCSRLGLTSFAYLWRRDQEELLAEMISCQVRAIVVKVASLGLEPDDHLGKEISELFPHLIKMKKKFGLNVCGEGGEYETFTLDCPLFKKRIVIAISQLHYRIYCTPLGAWALCEGHNICDEQETVIPDETEIAPVGYIKFKRMHVEDKPWPEMSQNERLKCCNLLGPINFLLDLDVDFKVKDVPLAKDGGATGNYENRTDEFAVPLKPRLAVSATGFFSVSDIQTGDGDPVEETRKCFSVLTKLLSENGLRLSDLVAVQLFVRDMKQFAAINCAYKEFFDRNPPSRVCVQVPLPVNVGFILNCSGFSSKMGSDSSGNSMVNHMHVQGVSHWAPANIGPYSQAVQAEQVIYVAGQIGLVPGTMQLIEGGIEAESHLALRSAERVLAAMDQGTSLAHVVSCVCYVTQPQYAAVARRAWSVRYGAGDHETGAPPFLQCVVVPALPRGSKVEWHVVARSRHSESWKWNRSETMLVDSVSVDKVVCSFENEDDVTEGFLMAFCVQPDAPQENVTFETLEKLLSSLVDAAWPSSTNAALQFHVYYSCSLVSRCWIQEAWTKCVSDKNATLCLIPVLKHQNENCIFSVISHFHSG